MYAVLFYKKKKRSDLLTKQGKAQTGGGVTEVQSAFILRSDKNWCVCLGKPELG